MGEQLLIHQKLMVRIPDVSICFLSYVHICERLMVNLLQNVMVKPLCWRKFNCLWKTCEVSTRIGPAYSDYGLNFLLRGDPCPSMGRLTSWRCFFKFVQVPQSLFLPSSINAIQFWSVRVLLKYKHKRFVYSMSLVGRRCVSVHQIFAIKALQLLWVGVSLTTKRSNRLSQHLIS